jgi:hypothetical protein
VGYKSKFTTIIQQQNYEIQSVERELAAWVTKKMEIETLLSWRQRQMDDLINNISISFPFFPMDHYKEEELKKELIAIEEMIEQTKKNLKKSKDKKDSILNMDLERKKEFEKEEKKKHEKELENMQALLRSKRR